MVGVLIVGGGVALLGAGGDGPDDERLSEGITIGEFRAAAIGSTRPEVRAQLGPPPDAMHFERAISDGSDGSGPGISCSYYPEKGERSSDGRSFQLCFKSGRLDSKRVQ